MTKGVWVWPSDQRGQRRVLRMVAASPHMLQAMTALGKSKEGMSNAELGEVLNDGSEWPTLWVVRQLTSLGFIELKVDFFGNPARYQLTEAGKASLALMTGQPPKPQVSSPPAPQPVAPKAA
jgi:hypothetical protein